MRGNEIQGKLKAPPPSSDAALSRMKAAKPKDTAPEITLRSEIHRRGFRYRVDTKPLKELNRRADIVFRPTKVAVFVDGCFWHGCPEHGTWPKANAEFWEVKIKRNQKRDVDTNRRLEEAGWKVVRVWEHEDVEVAADRICNIVSKRSAKR